MITHSEKNATQPSLELADRVAGRLADLSPSEVRVASFILEHADDVAFLSVNDLARQLDSSDATIVRTAQALGYAGFPDLRRELRDAVRTRTTHAVRLERGLDQMGDTPATLLERAFDAQIDLLQQARRTVRPEAFEEALDILIQAQRILVFGLAGPAAHLAQIFGLRMSRIGRETLSISAAGMSVADTLLTMRPGDALVAIGDEHAPIETSVVLAEAKRQGVPVVLLTQALPARFVDRVRVALVAPRGEAGGFNTITTTVVLLDSLLLGVAARDRASALMNLDRFDRLRARLTRRRANAAARQSD